MTDESVHLDPADLAKGMRLVIANARALVPDTPRRGVKEAYAEGYFVGSESCALTMLVMIGEATDEERGRLEIINTARHGRRD